MPDNPKQSQNPFPYEVGEIRGGDLPAELLPNTMKEISDFTVGIVIGDDLLGSGTLVDVGGRRGILTAHHVASRVLNADEASVALIVADHAHRLCVRPSHLTHIIVGAPASSDDWRPDLSFLNIGDQKLLGTLASKKSFVHMDKRSEESYLAYPRREELWWFVAGFPAEFSARIRSDHSLETLTKSSNFVGQASLIQHSEIDGFDYLKLKVYDPAHGFPSNYGGVSGGGIWMVPLEMNPDEGPHTAKALELFLAGVCCYQHEAQADGREVEGHGPRSLYGKLKQALA